MTKVWLLMVCSTLLALPVLCLAQEEVEEVPELCSTSTPDEGRYEVSSMYVDGRRWATVCRLGVHLFGIPVAAGGLTPEQRARTIADSRLNVLYDRGVLSQPDRIRVGRMHGEVVIYVENPNNVGGLGRRTLILTIDSNYERFLRCSRWDIAFFWRDLMRLWSAVGLMKDFRTTKDPAGRPLDPEHSWHRVPPGYAAKYGW
jgi:hypothetical protein